MADRPRRDRTGEPLDDDDPDPDTHLCHDGWIDRHADQPRPCLVCKPHLAPAERRRRATGRPRR